LIVTKIIHVSVIFSTFSRYQ